MYGVIVDYLFLEVKSLNTSFSVSGDEADAPNTQYKKLRAGSPDVHDSGKQNKTETIKIETVSENTKAGSFTEESIEVGESIQNITCKNISKSPEYEHQSLFVYKKDLDVPDDSEREQIVLDDRSIDQNFETTESDPKKSFENCESKNDEYVCRLLRATESYNQGLRPKHISSKITLEEHVENGSKGNCSRFISCSQTMDGLYRLIRLTNNYCRVRKVVRINLTKLKDFKDVTIINLNDKNVREEHLDRHSKAMGYAHNFEEIVLAPKSHIPAECVERIGIVKDKQFIKDEHIDL